MKLGLEPLIRRLAWPGPVVLAVSGFLSLAARHSETARAAVEARGADPAVVSVYTVARPVGLMVTSGGWAYCQQVRALARTTSYTLLCGRYVKDGYLGYGLRSQRRLDWGNQDYLASLAAKVEAEHRQIGGKLVLIGVSYSGFAVATLASHHPELRPDRLIMIDSYLDLVARRNALPSSHETAHEIDAETGGSVAALQARNVSAAGLARLVKRGTQLTVIWSVSADEQREFNGATCEPAADAAVLQRIADVLHQPVPGWVTLNRHGHDLWDHGVAIVRGQIPGRQFAFRPGAAIPPGAACS